MYEVHNSTQLSSYLRALRKSRHLTQAELGAMLGVSAARVGKIERRPGAVTLDNLLDVLRLLGARIELVDQARVSSAARPGRTQSARQTTTPAARKTARGPVRPAGEW
jgi:HTH-type transcriptional regulator/antitoxin HipB